MGEADLLVVESSASGTPIPAPVTMNPAKAQVLTLRNRDPHTPRRTRARTSSRDSRVGDAVQPLNLHAHQRRRAPLHKRRLLNNVGLKALVRAVPRGRSPAGQAAEL